MPQHWPLIWVFKIPTLIRFILIFLFGIYLKSREREREIDLSLTGSLIKCPKQLGLSQAEVGSPELNLGLPHGGRDSRTRTITCCLPGCASAGSWIGSGALQYEMWASHVAP